MIPGAFPVASLPIAETTDSLKADIVASFPALTADLSAISPVFADGAATLPALTALLTSISPVAGVVAFASFPPLAAIVTAAAPTSAQILATLPALTASFRITTEARAGIRSWQQCPRPASGFTICGPVGSLREGPQQ